MDLPEKLNAHLGVPLCQPTLASSSGLSILGGHTLLLTDHPAFYLHDSGGLLGEDQVLKAEPLPLDETHIHYAGHSLELHGRVSFDEQHHATFRITKQADATAEQLRSRIPASGGYDSRLALSIECEFEEGLDSVLAALEGDLEVPRSDAELELCILAAERTLPIEVLAISWHRLRGEFSARVQVDGNRLRLSFGGETIADLPLSHLQFSREMGRRIVIDTTTLIAGHSASRTTLWFQTSAEADLFVAQLKEPICTEGRAVAGGEGTKAIANGVRVEGRGSDGGVVAGNFDVILTDTALEFRDATDQCLHRFCFDDPSLRIAGTSSAFLISDGKLGPLQVEIENPPFQERVYTHPAVKACAGRSHQRQPYLVRLDNRPATLAVARETLTIKSPDTDRQIPIASLTRVEPIERDGSIELELTIDTAEHRVSADLAVLQALHTVLHRNILIEQCGRRELDLPRATLAREGDYLLYTLFGRFYELHAALCREWGRGAELHPLELPEAHSSRLALASVIAQSTAPLLRHIDMLVYYLPTYLTQRDTKLFAGHPEEQAAVKDHESRYRGVLSAVRGLTGELSWMRETLLRIEGVEPVPDASTGLATLSLAAAAAGFLPPLFLVAGAERALGSSRRSKELSKRHGELTEESLRRVLEKWNDWIETMLPAFSHQIVEGLFPLRRDIARAANKLVAIAGNEPLRDRLAERLARLSVFLLFPDDSTCGHRRRDIVDAIGAARERIQYSGFAKF